MAKSGPRPKWPQLSDREWLEEQYVGQGRSTEEISAELGCSRPLVSLALKNLNIQTKGPGPRFGTRFRYEDRLCAQCGENFKPTGPMHLYCPTCARTRKDAVCLVCGKEFGRDYMEQTFCSKTCSYNRNGPNGKRSLNENGYVTIKVLKDCPGRMSNGRMLEHRYVMQEYL